ncbi:hypothetical protein [Streptomyces sp. NPDC054837]
MAAATIALATVAGASPPLTASATTWPAFLRRAQREGLLDPAADLEWTRRVYYALISEALHGSGADQDPDAQDPDALATRIVDTLLRGAGPRG